MKKFYKPKQWKVSYDAELDEMFVGVLPQPKGENYYCEGVMYHLNEKGEIAVVDLDKLAEFLVKYIDIKAEDLIK